MKTNWKMDPVKINQIRTVVMMAQIKAMTHGETDKADWCRRQTRRMMELETTIKWNMGRDENPASC